MYIVPPYRLYQQSRTVECIAGSVDTAIPTLTYLNQYESYHSS